MNRLLRFCTLLIAWMALLPNLSLPDGILLIPLTVFKIISSSLSLFLAILSGLGTLFGLLRRDRLSFLAGLLGIILAIRHINQVTSPHREFEFTFGANWRQRIPHHLTWRLRQKRYTVQPLPSATIAFSRDVNIGQRAETDDLILADVWHPPAGVPHTAVAILFLHAGGWHYGDKDYLQLTRPLFQHLTNQGHLIVDVAYTMAPKAGLVSMIADVKRAIVWLKENAEALQINPNRIVLMGESAGAHLALLAAYTPNHPILDPADVVQADTAVRAVISYYGVTDLVNGADWLTRFQRTPSTLVPQLEKLFKRVGLLPRYGRLINFPDMIPNLIGGLPEDEPDLYHLGSPITHVGSHCPATLLINGTHDAGTSPEQHRQLHASLYRHQVASVHVELESADHIFDLIAPRWSPAAHAALYDVERFLALLV